MTIEERKRHLRNCIPIPNPNINNKLSPIEQYYVHNCGIVTYLFPNYKYHFFRILRNEKMLGEREKSSNMLLGRGLISMN